MNNQVITRDMNAIRKLGIEALMEKLGPVGMVEFMHQFDSGYGDYTKERHAWLDNLTIEDISREIKNVTVHGYMAGTMRFGE
ncbi:hypothetical protein FACS189445_3490 [Spirochaetia bacterium]|nr:hypothetical protein FACS189445_3490 [Spirochaetia bacterium]